MIDLNPRALGKDADDATTLPGQGIQLSDHGVPLCAAQHPMRYDGFCKNRGRHKWCCSRLRKGHPEPGVCQCSASAYGRTVYTYHEDNLRFFPRIARGTEAWKTIYAKRTSVERSNKRKKIDYKLEATKVRSTVAWTWRSILTAMCQHIDAWYKASGLKGRDLVNSWLPVLTAAA
ncbi:MAG: DDE transposase, partial [Dehalococcoidia bacterium]|nr:DDE transposase [Dehalococcoidia bacterium]